MRPLPLLNALLLAAHWGFAVWAWPDLPEAVPAHFDLSGEPTRWESPSRGSWFGLPVVATLTAALVGTVAWAAPRYPRLMNLPDKDRLLALPPERQRPVLRRSADLLGLLTAPILLAFGMIQVGMWWGAHGQDTTALLVSALVVSALSAPIGLALGLPRVQAELDRQHRAHEETRADPRS
jgi:uncharacterized membrane protein